MSEGIDLYADDIDSAFVEDDYYKEPVDLYEDVLPIPAANSVSSTNGQQSKDRCDLNSEKCITTMDTSGDISREVFGRRHQLYIGNLTWWTTDQDITNAVKNAGVTDFIEVKFFENRINGQSKGYCVISMKSEHSIQICMDELPKIDLHGRQPVVTLPTKQALNLFESQNKTRQVPQLNQSLRIPHPLPYLHASLSTQQRMMSRPVMGPPGIPQNQAVHNNSSMLSQYGIPMRYGLPRHQMPQTPQMQPMYQAPPRMDLRAPRPDWNRPPHLRPPYHSFPPPQQGPSHINVPPPILPRPMGPYGPRLTTPQDPASKIPFNQPGVPGTSNGSLGPPPRQLQPHIVSPHGLPHYQSGVDEQWSGKTEIVHQPPAASPLSESEFDKTMSNNRTISSTAISRAVSDTAAGQYESAIETLGTAISLIQQSRVAQDDRCKILISSLRDTLHGIENKGYAISNRRRTRSRDFARSPRERSINRYRERSIIRHDRDRSHDRDTPDKSRQRSDYYRDYEDRRIGDRRRARNKSPNDSDDWGSKQSKRMYYDSKEKVRFDEKERERRIARARRSRTRC